MYENLVLFQTAAAKAQHAGKAQAMVARNIANADTPGYRAQHLISFDAALGRAPALTMQMTRTDHLVGGQRSMSNSIVVSSNEPSPNGNSVAIEDEMLKATQVGSDHRQALAVYQHTMTVLRTALGR